MKKRNAMPAGRQGFSLIELLVVISIIASIVALAIPNYLSARQRAQDSKTKSEMAAFKTALRLYYNDYAKYPPNANPGTLLGCKADGVTLCPCTTGGSDFATGAACDNIYMKQMPTGLGSTMLYHQTLSGDDFCVRGVLNNLSDPDITASQTRCAKACAPSYCTGTGRYCGCAD